MSIHPIDRRDFLTLALGLFLAPAGRLPAETVAQRRAYAVDVGILYHVFSFRLEGTMEEIVDRASERYQVLMTGQGEGIANRIESRGVLRGGRWTPLQSTSWFQVRGRESTSRLAYDHERRTVEYHARGETFFLRRLRVVDDVVAIPDGVHVDDGISASLNYVDGRWAPQPDGRLRTHVVRRRRSENEGPDDVASAYRAEITPFDLRMTTDSETGRPSALVDLSRFSSWARENRPARIVFDEARRPALITGSMILGTSVTIRLA